ncbi:hypothetical protein HZB69_04345 [Candidatus Amesbacteria bacterium]|nr:hypothetical protein [Candidatus Amesbacteria bacterium]
MTTLDRQLAIKILNEKYTNSRFAYPEEAAESWKVFVKRIVKGEYEGNENEYWNDLDTRDILEEIGYGQSEDVKKIDREFRGTLIHTDIRNWGCDEARTDDWWNFGYPSALTGYLKDKFESDIRFKKKF